MRWSPLCNLIYHSMLLDFKLLALWIWIHVHQIGKQTLYSLHNSYSYRPCSNTCINRINATARISIFSSMRSKRYLYTESFLFSCYPIQSFVEIFNCFPSSIAFIYCNHKIKKKSFLPLERTKKKTLHLNNLKYLFYRKKSFRSQVTHAVQPLESIPLGML